jgi:hypothetical protein
MGGDRLKNYWVLKIISQHFKVRLVSITDQKVPKEFYERANELGLSYTNLRRGKNNFI